MRINLSSAKYLILTLILIAVIVIVLLFKTFYAPKNSQNPSQGPQPGNNFSGATVTNEAETKDKQSLAVSNLIAKLPYQGKNFKVRYDFATHYFLLTLKQSNEDQANQEFDQFLRGNGVAERAWLDHIHVDYY